MDLERILSIMEVNIYQSDEQKKIILQIILASRESILQEIVQILEDTEMSYKEKLDRLRGKEMAKDKEENNSTNSTNLNKLKLIAQELILEFVKDKFGEKYCEETKRLFGSINVSMDFESDLNSTSYFKPPNNIFVTNASIRANDGMLPYNIDLLASIIHEYAHSFSYKRSEEPINDVIEEGMANSFSELVINHYIEKHKAIETIQTEDNARINREGYKSKKYLDETDIVKALLYVSRKEKQDIKMIEEYFYGNQKYFSETLVEILGQDCEEMLEIMAMIKIHRKGIKSGKDGFIENIGEIANKLEKLIKNYGEKEENKDKAVEILGELMDCRKGVEGVYIRGNYQLPMRLFEQAGKKFSEDTLRKKLWFPEEKEH